MPKRFPGIEFFFQPADIVTQILNFGLPAAIDVQFSGNDLDGNAALAAELVKAIRQIPGAVDVHVHQRLDGPGLNLQMDRTRLQQFGLTASNVGQNVLIALSGSSQTAPAFWLNPQNGVVYNVAVQSPQYTVDSLDSLLNIPVAAGSARHGGGGAPQLLGNLVDAQAGRQPAVVSRYNIAPVIDVYVSVQGTDLASVAAKVKALVDEMRPKLPRGSQVTIRGQVQTMQSSFIGPGRRAGDGGRARLSADRGQFPVVDRRRHHHHRAAGRARRHRVDAVPHRHHAERAGADGRDHDHGRGHSQQHLAGRRSRANGWRQACRRCRPRSKRARRASGRC